MKKSKIDHPDHYTFGKIEPIDVVEDWELGFHLGNAIKYIARAPHKGSYEEDLKKAAWYIQRKICKLHHDNQGTLLKRTMDNVFRKIESVRHIRPKIKNSRMPSEPYQNDDPK